MSKNIDNLQFSKKLLSLILAGSLSFTLAGCASNQASSNENNDSTIEQPEEENTGIRGALDNIGEKAGTAINDEYEKVKGDDAVEAAITIMIDGAEKVANATDEFKQTKEYEEAKESVKENFDTLLQFCSGEKELDGYTIDEVSDKTKEKAKNALHTLDAYIESNIPEYKEKAKEKLKSAGEWLWDKSTDAGAYLKEKGSQWLDDVEEKVKQR